jgi:ligand-binding sensor domain-containing protein
VKRSFLILIALFLLAWSHLTRAQQINIWKYNIEDGLVNNDILNIYQDSRGFMWLSTRGGLSRYDGSRFTRDTRVVMLTISRSFGNQQVKSSRQRKTASEDEIQRTN